MAVRKRKWFTASGEERETWIVDYYDRDGERHIETFAKKRDADAKHAEVSVNVRAGMHIARSKSKTVGHAGKAWVDAARVDGLERSTVESYEAHLRLHIAPRLGDVELSDLSKADVQSFADSLRADGVSQAMTRKVLFSLGALIEESVDCGLVARNVVREISRTRRQRKAQKRDKRKLKVGIDIPKPEEITAFLAASKGRWRPLFMAAAFTGLRASELRGLCWAHVDLKASKLHVTQRADKFHQIGAPKSDASKRTVPFGPMLCNTLKEWKLACPKGELDLVFPNTRGKIEALPNILQRGLLPTMKAAGLPYTGMHCLRHFFASWCIDRGMSPKVIQERMGHSTITETFDTYGHLFPKDADAEEMATAEMRLIAT